MIIVHVCITSNVFNEDYAYQDNLLSKAHKKMNHDVTIVTSTYAGFDKNTNAVVFAPSGKSITKDGVKLFRLKQWLPHNINQHIHFFRGFKKIINELNPDLLFLHGVTSPNYRYLKNYKKRHPEVKIVFDSHTDLHNSCQNMVSYIYNRYFVRYLIISRIRNISNCFYGVTPARCVFLNQFYGVPSEKIHLLPMGADDDEMNINDKLTIREEIRERLRINNDDFLIVTGGKIDPLKNIHVLAEAVNKSSNKKIKLLMFGSIREDMKNTINSLLSDRILYVGWIPSSEVYSYFYAADFVMFPGLHSVLWEQAVASKVPCAFSRIEGFEHVDIGGNCVLMDGKTWEYYLSLIDRIYLDKDYYNKLFQNSQSEKSKQFLYSQIAAKVISDMNNQC